MKGYMILEKGIASKGENVTFEEGQVFYKNPLDCLIFYPLIDENGELTEITEVEPLEEPRIFGNKGFYAKKFLINAKLNLHDYIKAGKNFVFENCKEDEKAAGNYSRLVSTDDDSCLVSTGTDSRLVSAGGGSCLVSTSVLSCSVAAGNCSQLVSTGAFSCSVAAGAGSCLVSTGADSRLVSTGTSSCSVAAENCSQLVSVGNCSRLVSTGAYSSLMASGWESSLKAGENSSLAATGACSTLAAGENSIVAGIGYRNRAKAAKGSWIVLAEYDKYIYMPICVKAAQVDGKKIKADTWYELKGGEFTETT